MLLRPVLIGFVALVVSAAPGSIVGLASGAARAQSPPGRVDTPEELRREKVIALISNEEREPTLEDWERIGPEANRILVDLAQDPTLDEPVRLSAIENLAWFPSRRTRAVLGTLLMERKAPAKQRGVALEALGAAFGLEVFEYVRGFLEVREPTLRAGAIRALGHIRGRRARQALEHHLSVEPALLLRQLVEETLEAMKTPPRGARGAPDGGAERP